MCQEKLKITPIGYSILSQNIIKLRDFFDYIKRFTKEERTIQSEQATKKSESAESKKNVGDITTKNASG